MVPLSPTQVHDDTDNSTFNGKKSLSRKLKDIDLSVTSRRMCLVCEWSLLGFFSSD